MQHNANSFVEPFLLCFYPRHFHPLLLLSSALLSSPLHSSLVDPRFAFFRFVSFRFVSFRFVSFRFAQSHGRQSYHDAKQRNTNTNTNTTTKRYNDTHTIQRHIPFHSIPFRWRAVFHFAKPPQQTINGYTFHFLRVRTNCICLFAFCCCFYGARVYPASLLIFEQEIWSDASLLCAADAEQHMERRRICM